MDVGNEFLNRYQSLSKVQLVHTNPTASCAETLHYHHSPTSSISISTSTRTYPLSPTSRQHSLCTTTTTVRCSISKRFTNQKHTPWFSFSKQSHRVAAMPPWREFGPAFTRWAASFHSNPRIKISIRTQLSILVAITAMIAVGILSLIFVGVSG